MRTQIILLGLMLFAMANSAEGKCVMFDFNTNSPSDRQYNVLNAYDNSGLFKGYLVCDSEDINSTHMNVASEYSIGSNDVSARYESSSEYSSITVYSGFADTEKPQFLIREESMRNASIGQIDIDGYNATYFIREENTGTRRVDRETRKTLGGYGQTITSIEEAKNSMEKAKDAIRKAYTGDYRTVNTYTWVAELYMPIDSKTVFKKHISGKSPEDSIHEFTRRIHVTKVTGENPRYLINEGNRLFKQGLFENALSIYSKIAAYGKYQISGEPGPRYREYKTDEVFDNMGIALYKLNRTNESLEWFDLNKPRSSKTWTLYGQLLESKNYIEEAEYAYHKANTI